MPDKDRKAFANDLKTIYQAAKEGRKGSYLLCALMFFRIQFVKLEFDTMYYFQ